MKGIVDCKDRSLVPADVVLSHNDKECIMGLDSVVLREGGSTVSVLDNNNSGDNRHCG